MKRGKMFSGKAFAMKLAIPVIAGFVLQVQDLRGQSVGEIIKTEGLGAASLVNLYPNPTSDLLNIDFKSNVTTLATISIYDGVGQLINKQDLQPNTTTTLSLSGLPKGVYFYRVENAEVVNKSGKIVLR